MRTGLVFEKIEMRITGLQTSNRFELWCFQEPKSHGGRNMFSVDPIMPKDSEEEEAEEEEEASRAEERTEEHKEQEAD